MNIIKNPRIWEFDVDDTVIMWNRSEFSPKEKITINHVKGPVELVPNKKNINLLIKLSKIGWYIRVHSGSGVEWAQKIVTSLGLEKYVDSVESKPLGKTDDKPPGDGFAYLAYRDPKTGKEP